MTDNGHCRFCGSSQANLGQTIMQSGARHIWERCGHCGRNFNGAGVFRSRVRLQLLFPDLDLDSLPVFEDYTERAPLCEVCQGDQGVELHHWAPRQIFADEADQWPTSWLCRQHHREWHRKINRLGHKLKHDAIA